MESRIEAMIRKVKIMGEIAPENMENDATIRLMLEDAMQAVRIYCHRTSVPEPLEIVVREMVHQAMGRDNGGNVASIKRGDTQINYNTPISADDFTERQKKLMNSFRKIRVG